MFPLLPLLTVRTRPVVNLLPQSQPDDDKEQVSGWRKDSSKTVRSRDDTRTVKMASEEPSNPMAESGVTIRSDSEQYSGVDELSASPPESSSPPLVLYQPPTVWSLLRGAAINLILPFINGMMLGFGELFAHEAAYKLGWGGTKVGLPLPRGWDDG